MTTLWIRGITLAVAVVALAVVPAAVTAQNDQTFIVEQESTCVQVTPLGDGTQSVEEFYDYRSPATTPEGAYASYGTKSIQQSQTSQLFVYNGTGGLSLVFLHDKLGDSGGGFAATAEISGLPADGEWAVEDDAYTNRDDVFDHTDTSSHIEWVTNGNRTDGAAFRGLGSPNYSTIDIDIAFNEDSNRYPFKKWDEPPEQNHIEQWIVRSGTGETTELDMSEPVTVGPGTCRGERSRLTATPGPNARGTDTSTKSATATQPTAAPTTATPLPADESTNAASAGDATQESDNWMFGQQSDVVIALATMLVLLATIALVRQGN